MKSPEFRTITDELLSAYLDNAVSDQERTLVEAAVIAEPDIAWRLDSLRQTVQLLKSLPELALPRSFVLQEAQVGDAPATRHAAPRANAPAGGFWAGLMESWRALWQAGNPVLRNAAAAGFVLLLVLMVSTSLLSFQLQSSPQSAAVQVASAPVPLAQEAQPAQNEAAARVAPTTATTAAATIVEQPAAEEAAEEQPNAKSGPATSAVMQEEPATESVAESVAAAEAAQAPAARTVGEAEGAAAAPAEDTADGASPTAEPTPEIAAAASAFTIQEESAQEESAVSEGDAILAQPDTAPAAEAAQTQTEPGITPVAPVPGGVILSGPEARGMGGSGGDGVGAGGGPGAPGDLPAYPDGAGGLLPPGAYESGPDFVPAEPAAAMTGQEIAPLETQTAEAVALLPPAEPTETPMPEPTPVPASGASVEVTTEETAPAAPTVTGSATRAVLVTGTGLMRLAQIGLGLITLMLASLWWHSRGETTKP